MVRWGLRESTVTGDHEVLQVHTAREGREGGQAVMVSLVLTAVTERRDLTDHPGPGVCRGYRECLELEDTEAGLASPERKGSWALWVQKEKKASTDRWVREVRLVLLGREEREVGMEHLDLLE